MAKKLESQLLINSVELLEINGEHSFPTALRLEREAIYFGSPAFSNFDIDPTSVNENFKVALGDITPGRSVDNRRRFRTACGEEKSAFELSKIFIDETLNVATNKLYSTDSQPTESILVSEPVAFFDHKNPEGWISNYRSNLRRILESRFKDVEFLPEPFAVFQYYRYGKRHPVIIERKKYIALVIDFGGGTFDISVIETTRQGDISQSGKHSKPLSSSSVPVGGFEINQELAREILMAVIDSPERKKEARKQVENYHRWKSGELSIDSLALRNQSFIKNYEILTRRIEKRKIALTGLIKSWNLDSPIEGSISVEVPADPFSEDEITVPYSLTASQYRDVFIARVWNTKLRNGVKNALKRAHNELGGKSINVMLVSGGSANIGWLEKLLVRDFATELSDTTPISLTENFQHIVSKGLAVECARRKHDPDSEFVSVTYNPLTLVLSTDDSPVQIKRFRPLHDDLPKIENDGQLLPSATALLASLDKPLRWKVRLDSPPKRKLEYYFMRASLDHTDIQSRFNSQTTLHTKKGTSFESTIKVELQVSEDGTVRPRFVYKTDRSDRAVDYVDGDPFVIDMTAGDRHQKARAYFGLDFGSSNSAVSYVSQASIEVYNERAKDDSWLNLNELIDHLPFPLSRPTQEYISCTASAEQRAKCLLSCFEAGIQFLGTLSFSLLRNDSDNRRTRILKTYLSQKRSLGPLNNFFNQSLEKCSTKFEFVTVILKASEREFVELGPAIEKLNNYKHDKLPAEEAIRLHGVLEKLLNLLRKALRGWRFGYFEDVKKLAFASTHTGIFRVANVSTPFYEVLDYSGEGSFSKERAYLVHPESGVALDFSPIFLWIPTRFDDPNSQSCLLLDGYENKGDTLIFSIVGRKDLESFSRGDKKYMGLFEEIDQYEECDTHIPVIKGLKFRDREER